MRFDTILTLGFGVHDALSGFLARHLGWVKTALLVVAHLSLLGIFFPQLGRSYGSLARDILLVIMFLSPLSKIFQMRLLLQLMGLRRELGIWFGYLAIVHGLSFLLDPDWAAVFIASHFSQPWLILPRYLFGLIALVLTLPLLLTSNNVALRLLKGNWKRLHRLAYFVLLFTLLHSFFPRHPSVAGEVIGWAKFGVVFGGYILLKLLAWNNFLTPLRTLNEYVGRKYGECRGRGLTQSN